MGTKIQPKLFAQQVRVLPMGGVRPRPAGLAADMAGGGFGQQIDLRAAAGVALDHPAQRQARMRRIGIAKDKGKISLWRRGETLGVDAQP